MVDRIRCQAIAFCKAACGYGKRKRTTRHFTGVVALAMTSYSFATLTLIGFVDHLFALTGLERCVIVASFASVVIARAEAAWRPKSSCSRTYPPQLAA